MAADPLDTLRVEGGRHGAAASRVAPQPGESRANDGEIKQPESGGGGKVRLICPLSASGVRGAAWLLPCCCPEPYVRGATRGEEARSSTSHVKGGKDSRRGQKTPTQVFPGAIFGALKLGVEGQGLQRDIRKTKKRETCP